MLSRIILSCFQPSYYAKFYKKLKKPKKNFFIQKKFFFQKCPKTLNNTEDPLVHIVVNFFSIPQSGLGDMASLPVPNSLSLVLYLPLQSLAFIFNVPSYDHIIFSTTKLKILSRVVLA